MSEHFVFLTDGDRLSSTKLAEIETGVVSPFDYDENLQNFYQELREQRAAAAAAEESARYDRIANALVDVNGAYDKVALGAE